MKFRILYLIVMLLTITACGTTPVSDAPTVSGLNQPDAEVEPLALVETTPLMRAPSYSSNAVSIIVVNAREAMEKGNYQVAAAQLERAVRIEPRNALLWHYLAKVRFNQGRYSLAANLASKSTLLARGDQALRTSNATLIKQAQAAFTTR